MDDTISRQAAIDAVNCNITITGRQNAELVASTIGMFADRIKALPSAQQDHSGDVNGKVDLIDRQAVIDLLKQMRKDGDMVPWEGKDVFARIRKLPSAQPEEPQWIPCKTRLPEESGTYLVSGKWGSGKVDVGDCVYYKEDGYFDTAWNFDVLAWRELPEPWRGEE